MGVPTFYKWLSVKYPKIVKDAVEGKEPSHSWDFPISDVAWSLGDENPNGEFDALYLDMNGIIHPCSHPESGAAPATEAEMIKRIFEYIDRLLRLVQPRKLLYMAIDGVAPRAKMNQQRTRRFKAAAEAAMESKNYLELKEKFLAEGRSIPSKPEYWDSNVITPGTTFLDNVSQALRYYINDRMTSNVDWKKLKVILSDATSPGEGEHKIMQFIRSQRTYPNYQPNLRHCLYGADADLIMLGLATHEPNFFILRESVMDKNSSENNCYICHKPGHYASDCTASADATVSAPASSSWKPMQFLQIGVLREYLKNEFSFVNSSPGFHANLERCIDDFVMMCFFVGNDFLPHLPSLSIHKGSIDQMLLLYQKIRPIMSDYLTNAGKINLPELKSFIGFLGQVEETVFIEDMRREQRIAQRKHELDSTKAPARESARPPEDLNFAALQQLKHIGIPSTTQLQLNVNNETSSSISPLMSPATSPKRLRRTHEKDIDEFKTMIREKKKAHMEVKDPEDNAMLGVGSPNEWRTRYYMNKFHLVENDLNYLNDFASRVAHSYVEGLRWVLGYYYQGIQSWDWFYPFHYAPFASDIAAFGTINQREFIYGKPFKPFDQLMAVLPANSSHCLPDSFSSLMTKPSSPLIDFYPLEFKEDPNGRKWQWVCLLPFIDQNRLLSTLQPLETTLTPDEQRRNTQGVDRLFVCKSHHLAKQMASIQLDPRETINFPFMGTTQQEMSGILTKDKDGLTLGVSVTPGNSFENGDIRALTSVVISCGFDSKPRHAHVCRFLKGANSSPPVLTLLDLQEQPGADRRFNSASAKRMIMGVLGHHGIVTRAEVQCHQYGRNYHQSGYSRHR